MIMFSCKFNIIWNCKYIGKVFWYYDSNVVIDSSLHSANNFLIIDRISLTLKYLVNILVFIAKIR